MACRLFGAKPLPEPMLTYCHLGSLEQASVIFESKYENFFIEVNAWKMLYAKCPPF